MKFKSIKEESFETLVELSAELAKEDPALELKLAQMTGNKTDLILAQFKTLNEEMIEMKEMVRRLAPMTEPVLITGPSGTGKEIIARALHGIKHDADFYAVNCAGVPDTLIESELFGHVAGAFTGAVRDHNGILAAAKGGTVFLDEIGEAPAAFQAKLLRALQPDSSGRYWIRRVGATTEIQITTRIIAATKDDLFNRVKAGTFRNDLYGRLMTYEIQTTPLSRRPEDKTLILKSLGIPVESQSGLESDYWRDRIELFNVRALEAYAKRKMLT